MKKTITQTSAAYLALLLMVSVTLSSCSKGGSESSSSGSALLLLTGGARWTVQKYEDELSNGTWILDPNNTYDNFYTIGFSTNNTFSLAPTNNGSGVLTGTWSFSSNYTVLTVAGSGTGGIEAASYTVSTLSSSTLVLTMLNYQYTSITGYTTFRVTLTH